MYYCLLLMARRVILKFCIQSSAFTRLLPVSVHYSSILLEKRSFTIDKEQLSSTGNSFHSFPDPTVTPLGSTGTLFDLQPPTTTNFLHCSPQCIYINEPLYIQSKGEFVFSSSVYLFACVLIYFYASHIQKHEVK